MPKVDPRAPERRLLKLAAWFLAHGPATREEVYAEFSKDYTGNALRKEKKWTRDKRDLLRLGVPLRFSEDGGGMYRIEPGSWRRRCGSFWSGERGAHRGRRTCSAGWNRRPPPRWLETRLVGTGVRVRTVSGLAWATVKDAGDGASPPADLTDPGYWRDTMLKAGDLAEPRRDSVIADEAQDLQDEAWLLVASLTPHGTRLWAFHDPGQSFWPDRKPPTDLFATATRFKLRGEALPAGDPGACERWLGEPHDDAALKAACADGVLSAVESPSASAVPDKIGAEIDRMLSQGLEPGDIAVVSLRGQTVKDAIFMHERIGRHGFVRAAAPNPSENVVPDSFLRWKGLERPAVIVTDLPVPGTQLKQLRVRMYVALTRAMVCARLAGTSISLPQPQNTIA